MTNTFPIVSLHEGRVHLKGAGGGGGGGGEGGRVEKQHSGDTEEKVSSDPRPPASGSAESLHTAHVPEEPETKLSSSAATPAPTPTPTSNLRHSCKRHWWLLFWWERV